MTSAASAHKSQADQASENGYGHGDGCRTKHDNLLCKFKSHSCLIASVRKVGKENCYNPYAFRAQCNPKMAVPIDIPNPAPCYALTMALPPIEASSPSSISAGTLLPAPPTAVSNPIS